jgi:hypothetical protein
MNKIAKTYVVMLGFDLSNFRMSVSGMGKGVFDLRDCILSFVITLTDLNDNISLEHEIGSHNSYFHNNLLFFQWKLIKIIWLDLGI